MEDMVREAKHPVRTTEKTLELLSFLKENDGAGVSEAANDLDMGKSAVHNHLSTLEQHEYVVKEGGEYRLSLRFLELAGHQCNQMKLYDVGTQQAEQLAKDTGELANLATEEYGQCIYLYLANGDRSVELDTYAGVRTGLHNTALGKAMLAHLPNERVSEILDQRGMEATTENTITDRELLFSELETIRERGVAFDREERLSGLRCVAAPIIREDDTVAGAISVAGPTGRLRGDRFSSEIPDMARSAANVIELNLTHS